MEDKDARTLGQFLEAEIDRHIATYCSKQLWNKRATHWTRGALILATALTTVLLGLKSYVNDSWVNPILLSALLISAASGALTAWESFAQHAQRWIRARTIVAELHEIRDDLRYQLEANVALQRPMADKFFDRIKDVLSSENEHWLSNRANAITGSAKQP